MVVNLTTVADVKREARITSEFTDAEVGSEIANTSFIISDDYGSPLQRFRVVLDNNFSVYYFNEDRKPAYSVERVILQDVNSIGGIQTGSVLTEGTDYTLDLNTCEITFSNDIITTESNGWVIVEFIPYQFHLLATYEAALALIDDTVTINGETFSNPDARKLKRRIDRLVKNLRPRTIAKGRRSPRVHDPLEPVTIFEDRSFNPH